MGLVVGCEGEGIRPLVRSKCDIVLKLPMRGKIESLNAAVAGSVALYLAYLARQETRRLETRRLLCLKQPIISRADFYGGRQPPRTRWKATIRITSGGSGNRKVIRMGTSGLACDWWGGRWKEDFDRAAEGGQNAHRLSVEWSRIQPTPDTWDEDALERYRTMLRGLRERGMTPMVTLHHFSDPLWFYEMNGWEQEEAVPLFEKFVRKTVEALKEYCTLWCTINEPNVYALSGYVTGDFPDQASRHPDCDAGDGKYAERACRRVSCHPRNPAGGAGGLCHHHRPMVAKRSWSPLDALMRKLRYDGVNMAFPIRHQHRDHDEIACRKVPGS